MSLARNDIYDSELYECYGIWIEYIHADSHRFVLPKTNPQALMSVTYNCNMTPSISPEMVPLQQTLASTML